MGHARVTRSELALRRFVNMQAGNPRRLRAKPPTQLFPRAARLAYQKALIELVRKVAALIKSEIADKLPRLVAETAAVRNDSPADEVRRGIDRVAVIMGESIAGDASVTLLAENVARSTSRFNREQVSRQTVSTLGIDIASEPYLADHLRSFVVENVRLIKSVVGQPLADTEAILQRGIRRGLRHEQIAAQIEARTGVAENRARLIARDQTAKLNGELTQLRQQSIGITRYIWSTSKDERVRESHQALDGTIQEWANPPIVDGEPAHPGEPINCRCVAVPVTSDLL